MSIRTPIIASAAGCLDSAGLVDGMSFNAHHLRTIASQANRLLAKGQAGPVLSWPTGGFSSEVGATAHEAKISSAWEMVCPPIPWMKMPGGGYADMRLTIECDGDVQVSVTSSAAPVPGATNNTLSISAASMAAYSLDSIPIGRGVEEELRVYIRGELGTGSLGETASFGTPNSSASAPSASTWYIDGQGDLVQVVGPPTWVVDAPGIGTWATLQHVVIFLDVNGDPLVAPRRIVGVPASDRLLLNPPLVQTTGGTVGPGGGLSQPADDYRRVMSQAAGYEIRQSAGFQLGSIAFRQRGMSE